MYLVRENVMHLCNDQGFHKPFYTKHCFHAHNNGIVKGIYQIDHVGNIVDIRKNIDDIPGAVYSVYTFDDAIIMSSENIAFNKILIKLRLLSHYDKASLIWV